MGRRRGVDAVIHGSYFDAREHFGGVQTRG